MASKIYQGLALAVIGTGGAFVACGPSASDGPNPPASTSTVTPPPVTTTSATDTTSTSVTPPATPNDCDGPGDAYVPQDLNGGTCTTTAPPNCLVNELAANFACEGGVTGPGVGDCSDCCWGDETSLSGGSFTYDDGAGGSIAYTKGTDSITLTGTAVDYAGFGMWFGPCTDASTWDGLEISVRGDLGGGQLFVQLQTDQNYPIGDGKGSCDWETEGYDDSTKWNYCTNPQVEVTGIDANSLAPFRFKWADFTGGAPNNPTVDPLQLLGVQIQIGCAPSAAEGDSSGDTSGDTGASSAAAVPCNYNLELLDIRWYKEAAAQ
jgi:hypothetical protein